MNFLKNTPARVLTLVLLLQAVAYYGVAARSELTPAIEPLSRFPAASGAWRTVQDVPLEKEVLDVLKADDALSRDYEDASGRSAHLLVEFFKTQRYGQAPHSPKNCLPGSGFEPVESRSLPVSVPGRPAPIVINEYIVARGNQVNVVMYWYQSHNRIIASEYWAKFWLVVDAIRYRRSDTAMVRVVVPVAENDTATAHQTGVEFVQAVYPDIVKQLPI